MTDILTSISGTAARISLNRPKAIHALTLDMVHAMTAPLLAWQDDAAVEAVIIDHAAAPDGDPKLSRGFCAGGDIAFLRNSALNDDGVSGKRFFHDEYQLNHLLFTYPKPVIAFMDGITMGGGVGISLPCRYRVATENTRFAMPETGIGLFPDVGGGWYLSRLPGRMGQYLALTGHRLDGAECLALGLATHYLPATTLGDAKTRIIADSASIDGILSELSVPAPEPKVLADRVAIDRLFSSDRLEDVFGALKADGGAFARDTLETLAAKSPQTMKVALRQLKEGAAMPDFAAEMVQEYAIGARIVMSRDFQEGVRAVIIDKDNAPRWNPPAPEGVTDAMVDAIFAPLPKEEAWTPA